MILKNVVAKYTIENYEREELVNNVRDCYNELKNKIEDLKLLNNLSLAERALREFDATHELHWDMDCSLKIINDYGNYKIVSEKDEEMEKEARYNSLNDNKFFK